VSRKRPATILATLFLVAACGGSSVTATPPPNGNGNGTPAPAASSSAGGGTGPAASPVAASPGGTTGQGSTGALDPCALLTQAEVAAATGKAVGPGVSQNDGQQCQWEYSDPSDQFSGLDASLAVNADPEVFREDQQGGPLSKSAPGVGDEAYFVEAGNVVLLDFRKGDGLFEIGMNVAGSVKDQLPGPQQEVVEKQMALAALQRIP